jgi:hypothetical protein
MSMRQLWDKARGYGRVMLWTSDKGTYSVTITFDTLKHISLEAKSGYGHTDPEAALKAAIQKAEEIVQSLQQTIMGKPVYTEQPKPVQTLIPNRNPLTKLLRKE